MMRLEPIRQCKLVYNCLKMVFKIMTRPKNTEMGFESCFPPRLCNTATYGCLLTLRVTQIRGAKLKVYLNLTASCITASLIKSNLKGKVFEFDVFLNGVVSLQQSDQFTISLHEHHFKQ